MLHVLHVKSEKDSREHDADNALRIEVGARAFPSSGTPTPTTHPTTAPTMAVRDRRSQGVTAAGVVAAGVGAGVAAAVGVGVGVAAAVAAGAGVVYLPHPLQYESRLTA